jgi:MFS family permease
MKSSLSAPSSAESFAETALSEKTSPDRTRNRIALDAMTFFLADVQGGVGPFLAVLLSTHGGWDPAHVGFVMTISGIATVGLLAPAGALVDSTIYKRVLVVSAAAIVGISSIVLGLCSSFWPVAIAQGFVGASDALLPPSIAALSLGIVGRAAFTRRVGRNEAFNHAGNAFTATLAGVGGYLIDPAAALWLVAIFAAMSVVAVLTINAGDIDHSVARGSDGDPVADEERAGCNGFAIILDSRPLLAFTAAITLFHFANAAMLPLVGQRLSQGHSDLGSLFMGACIVTAQVVMVPMALLVGAKSDALGRKPLFLLGFAALPIRGMLYTFWDDPSHLIAVQLLDGVGAGLFGALFPLVIADLTRGSGHYNLVLGASAAAWGFGAASSNALAGFIAVRGGFNAAFLFLAGAATLAFLLFLFAVPETGDVAIRRRTNA